VTFDFRLGSIPVRVHGSFLFVVLALGYQPGPEVLPNLAQWFVVVFVGVLLHELGHALVGRRFGLTPRIDLIGLGGLTSWSAESARKLERVKRVAISLAGPFTGIAIGLFTLVTVRLRAGLPPLDFLDHPTPKLTSLTQDIVWVNLWWGVMNLLPILPMDGGNVLLQTLDGLTRGRGEKPARIVSIALAASIGLVFLLRGSPFFALLPALFAVQNIQALRGASDRERDLPLRAVLKSGFDALEKGDPSLGVRAANDVLARAADPGLRADALRLLAYGHLLTGSWGPLMELLESPAATAIDDAEMEKFERAARELDRPEEAGRIAAVRAARTAHTPVSRPTRPTF
jgi:stage IV sporulation protein FB